MTESTAELTAEEKAALEGLNLDPGTWEDPKQTFRGIVMVSEIGFASEEYRAATEFRPAITEPLPQWNYRIRRLDAQRSELDGSIGEVFYYGGHDLKKFNARANDGQGGLVPLSARYPKEWFISTENKKVFNTIHPPENLIGKIAMWDYYQTKAFGSVTAKRVLVPASILPPDYTYTGEKVTFQAREKEGEAGVEASADGVAQNGTATNGTAMLSIEQAKAILPALLVGQKRDDPASIIAAIPAEARLPEVLSGVATQDLLKEFVEEGTIVIAEDGLIGVGAN